MKNTILILTACVVSSCAAEGTAPTTGGAPGGEAVLPAMGDRPGHVPLRRLTRVEYSNTVRDLFGATGDPGSAIGLDEDEGGFASNSKAPLKELLIERYQQLAEEMAAAATTAATLPKLVSCAPATGTEAACADDFIRRFGKRAYRRPLVDEEVARYRDVFAVGKEPMGNFSGGIALVLSTLLQSPNFLYRAELGNMAAAEKDGLPLTAYEVATRLSYAITASTPDDDLLAVADTGKLKTPDEVAAQARRLWTSAKARGGIVSFFEQWLDLDDLPSLEKDPKAYPEFTTNVRTAMRDEIDTFAYTLAHEGAGQLDTLLTAPYSFPRDPLFPLYGVVKPTVATPALAPPRMDFPAGQRAGLFTLAGVMAKHGHADQSSPIGRGLLVLKKLLCTTPPPPPPNVDTTVPKADASLTTRARFERHRESPECAACHALIDPLGIPFEIYDGIGRYRTRDGNLPVDPASKLSGTAGSDGPIKDATDLMQRLSGAAEVRRCVARQWLRYSLGRWDGEDDEGAITAAVGAFGRANYRIADLVVGFASTRSFRYRTLPQMP